MDLAVVPHLTQVHIASDTVRTWRWSPTPKMLSSMNSQDKQRNQKSEKTPKAKIRLVCYYDFVTILSKSESDPMADTHILV